MELTRNQSEGIEIRLPDATGAIQPAAHIGYSIRPAQGFTISLDIFNGPLIDANLADVKASVMAFIDEAIAAAGNAGFPVGETEAV